MRLLLGQDSEKRLMNTINILPDNVMFEIGDTIKLKLRIKVNRPIKYKYLIILKSDLYNAIPNDKRIKHSRVLLTERRYIKDIRDIRVCFMPSFKNSF